MQPEFNLTLRGYKKEEVDEYIKKLENTINDYVSHKQKIDELMDLANEQSEVIINDAKDTASKIIKTAQKEATDIINNANKTSESILSSSKLEGDNLINETYNKLYSIQASIRDQRKLLDGFRQEYNNFILKYVNEINKRDFVHLQYTVDGIDNYISNVITKAESTKKGYFIPDSQSSDIIIVAPTENDIIGTLDFNSKTNDTSPLKEKTDNTVINQDINQDTNTISKKTNNDNTNETDIKDINGKVLSTSEIINLTLEKSLKDNHNPKNPKLENIQNSILNFYSKSNDENLYFKQSNEKLDIKPTNSDKVHQQSNSTDNISKDYVSKVTRKHNKKGKH